MINGINKFMKFSKEEHNDESIYYLLQNKAFIQSKLANQLMITYNLCLPDTLATSMLIHTIC